MFTANAATDIFYLYNKARDTQTAKIALHFLLTQYSVVSVTQQDCIDALSFSMDDFEDALVVACAQKAEADYILTRDDTFLHVSSPVAIMMPKDFVGTFCK